MSKTKSNGRGYITFVTGNDKIMNETPAPKINPDAKPKETKKAD